MSVRLDHGEESLTEVHEINVTPFIDVMLVLLIIFMVAAPLATVDIQVNLPASTAEPQQRPDKPVFLTLKPDLTLALGNDAVQRELTGLAMGRCRIEVAFLPPNGGVDVGGRKLAASGAERAEILIAPNPGEPPRPLARIASGGELSRILLAVKRTLSRKDPVATYVFDEVDAGIGGAVAEVVGRKLRQLGRARQRRLAQPATFRSGAWETPSATCSPIRQKSTS